jgi:hypothetical protein
VANDLKQSAFSIYRKGIILAMKPINSDWYFIPLALLVIFIIALNESGYGVFALFLLFPASWLMTQAFPDKF